MTASRRERRANTDKLRVYLNLMALDSFPAESSFPGAGGFRERLARVREAGFEGVQFTERATVRELSICAELGLGITGSGRVNVPGEAARLAERLAGEGCECATLHVGWGLEDDNEACRLIESIFAASEQWSIPLYVETHRATIFQDMWRTVNFVRQFPALRFNGDFSHWYTGQEMVYGGFAKKCAFIRPVIERVRFIHGRIGNPGCIQVRVAAHAKEQPQYVGHFQELWTGCFREFLSQAKDGDAIYFVPELLAPEIFYARTFADAAGEQVEESDRWEQSLALKQMAESCFAEAMTGHAGH